MTYEIAQSASVSPDSADSHFDVSVIIPVYNCERYIAETLQSVFDQKLGEYLLEVIVVDDGSTDDSLNIMTEIAKSHSNMTIESIPNSGSASAPRNRGLELATGEYVFFLDADDKLADGALETLLAVARETGSGVIACKLGPFGPSKRASALPSRAFKKSQFAVDFIDSKAYTTLGALKLFQTSILKEHKIQFPPGYAVGEDQPFTMLAYFHSPHVTILSDRIYYWARGRDDGTNVTSIGQPATEHYKKIKRLIEVIASFDLPAERRDPLLERPTVAPSGFRTVFGGSFLTLFDAQQRKEVVNELHKLVGPLMTKSLRAKGNLESQIIADLLCRNDVESLEQVCRVLGEREPLPLELDHETQQFVYRPIRGKAIGDLTLSIDPYLAQIEFSGMSVRVRGTAVLPGSALPPDRASIVWVHRRSNEQFIAPSSIDARYRTERGCCIEFSSQLDTERLELSSEWDSFIELQWGSYVARERFGKAKGKGLSTQPVFMGNPKSVAVFFTKFGNLSLDIGPTREYAKLLSNSHPQVVGSFPSPKRQSVIVEGQLANIVDATLVYASTSKERQLEWHRLTSTCIAIVLPRGITQNSRYAIRLSDATGNQFTVTDTGRVPKS